ncbi:hypothetical protein CAI21_12135 [Alkalilimnicola ehrlichii]|uniref:SCO family protein n=1 Tax=Alkalilimnicola ehrlichii TaxID=351052 RepID=A0A3E0WS05_9GAMM|nr:SCO family protein [Alkalilimnicola ehrlichii]RFA28600.1 hypothetical protein CAI21_12135 [Alkalilimnicola ehrlichii]RFA35764.1 hypothetical protein CAL65_12655 [Alkalilimnicola ehrlichii]
MSLKRHCLASLAALTLGLSSGTALAHSGHAHHHHGHHHEPLPAATVNHQDSLYHVEDQWTDHRGQSVALGDFRGQPVLITMIYGNCNTACPVLVNDLTRIQTDLPKTLRQQTRVLVISFDSLHDTPDALATYAEERALDREGWHFLHGEPHQIRTLATLLGVRYRDNGDGSFDHSNLIAALDEEGKIVHRSEGLLQPTQPIVQAISERATERSKH